MENFNFLQESMYSQRQKYREMNRSQLKTSLNQEKSLVIQIFNEIKAQCYDLIIDDSYLKCRQDLSTFFSSPQDIHFTLIQLNDQIITTEDYKVILNINLMASKVKMTKQFVFELNYNPSKTLVKQRQKITFLQQEMKSAYCELQLEKQLSRQKQEKSLMQIRQLRNQRSSLLNELQQAQQQIQILNSQLQEKEGCILQLKRSLSQRKDEISTYESSQNNSKSRIVELENSLKMLEISKYKKDLLINPANPHYYHFHYLQTDQGTIRIIKTANNGWTNIITNPVLPQSTPSVLQMKINHTKDGSISMGICNNSAFGSTDIDTPKAITYFVHDGRIFQKGARRLSGAAISCGQALRLQINWKSYCISWWNDQLKVGQALMDANFKLNNIFFIIRMYWKEDQIELK